MRTTQGSRFLLLITLKTLSSTSRTAEMRLAPSPACSGRQQEEDGLQDTSRTLLKTRHYFGRWCFVSLVALTSSTRFGYSLSVEVRRVVCRFGAILPESTSSTTSVAHSNPSTTWVSGRCCQGTCFSRVPRESLYGIECSGRLSYAAATHRTDLLKSFMGYAPPDAPCSKRNLYESRSHALPAREVTAQQVSCTQGDIGGKLKEGRACLPPRPG